MNGTTKHILAMFTSAYFTTTVCACWIFMMIADAATRKGKTMIWKKMRAGIRTKDKRFAAIANKDGTWSLKDCRKGEFIGTFHTRYEAMKKAEVEHEKA